MAEDPRLGSDEWWLKTLATRLHDRRIGKGWSWQRQNLDNDVRPGLEHLWSWMVGNPPLPECANGWHEAMRPMIRMCTVNIAPRICASVSDRMDPLGWRTAVDSDENGDQIAAEIALENRFGIQLGLLWDYTLSMGSGYTLVGPPRKGSKIPVVTVEDPRWTITHENARTGETEYGLKMYRNDWDTADEAMLAIKGGVRIFRRESRSSVLNRSTLRMDPSEWVETNDGAGKNPGRYEGCVLTPFSTPSGRGEYEIHLNVIRKLNDSTLNSVSIAKHQAFRQRGIKGLPDKDADGNKIEYPADAFLSDPGALWRLPEGVEIWESTPVDMNGIRAQHKDIYEEIAVLTGMPLFYVTPDAAEGSAEGASTQRESNTFRTRKYLRAADAGLALTQSKAFAVMGESERAKVSEIRTIWHPVEIHSLTEKSQAFAMQRQNGVPFNIAARDCLGYGPEDLPRIEAERARDAFYTAANATDTRVEAGRPVRAIESA